MSDSNPLLWPDDRLLTRAEASSYARAHGLRLAVSTLAKRAWRGNGPPILYFGRRPYYKLSDLREWLTKQTRGGRERQ